jgi:hypothetical protein
MTTGTEVLNAFNALRGDFQGLVEGAENATAQAQAAANLLPKITGSRVVYVDQQNGDDENDGLSAASAFQTMGKAFSSQPAGYSLVVRIIGDFVLNEYVSAWSAPPYIQIQGWDAAANASARVTISRTNNNSLRFTGHTHVWFLAVDIEVGGGTTNSQPLISVLNGSPAFINLTSCTITRDGLGCLLSAAGFRALNFVNVTIDPAAKGGVVAGIGANSDPNNYPLTTANFTSA